MNRVERLLPDPARREGRDVARMFGAIAPTYDRLNHILSLNVDRLWRRRAVRALGAAPGSRILDVCTGTGDLALALLRSADVRVVGVDFSLPMLERAGAKKGGGEFRRVQGDALDLPLRTAVADGAMVAFGVRNFQDLDRGLKELARVLRMGGRLVILEFSTPRGRLFGSLFRCYFQRVLPRVGRWVSGVEGPYGYLPASVGLFPSDEGLRGRLEDAGFAVESQRPLTGGIATLHVAVRGPFGGPP
jgi:demethylmenaquinone methyltransferase/2-methoxy-6-polyprenyl-1,4-benzoquinol methylase